MELDQIRENERRIDFFLKKKGIYHVKEDMINKLVELEDLMKQEGVSPQALRAGVAPENVLKKAEQLEVARIRARGVFGHNHWKAYQRGELENFEEEFKHYRDGEVKREVNTKELTESFNNFLDEPDNIQKASEYMRKKTMPEATLEEHLAVERLKRQEQSKFALERMKEKQFRQAVEEEKHRQKTINDAQALRNRESEDVLNDIRFGKPKASAPNKEFQEYSNRVIAQAKKELEVK